MKGLTRGLSNRRTAGGLPPARAARLGPGLVVRVGVRRSRPLINDFPARGAERFRRLDTPTVGRVVPAWIVAAICARRLRKGLGMWNERMHHYTHETRTETGQP